VHAYLLHRLSWSWTVLLPSDTQRKPITSITAVLLPFVTYLLTFIIAYSFRGLASMCETTQCHNSDDHSLWNPGTTSRF
jgi:hypothetical protein